MLTLPCTEPRTKAFAGYEIFDPNMHAVAVALLQLETDLRLAIERQEFRLQYQPIVSLETGRIIGFEALIRWQHPQYGLILPAEFIPAAEETGLITRICQWVIRSACAQFTPMAATASGNTTANYQSESF